VESGERRSDVIEQVDLARPYGKPQTCFVRGEAFPTRLSQLVTVA